MTSTSTSRALPATAAAAAEAAAGASAAAAAAELPELAALVEADATLADMGAADNALFFDAAEGVQAGTTAALEAGEPMANAIEKTAASLEGGIGINGGEYVGSNASMLFDDSMFFSTTRVG